MMVIARASKKPSVSTVQEPVQIRDGLQEAYADVFTAEVLDALNAMARFNAAQKELMAIRMERRAERFRKKKRIEFLNPKDMIAGTNIRVKDAREGKFVGSEIPND